MAFSDYPTNPTVGEEYIVGNMRVLWDGTKFMSVPPVFAGNINSIGSADELRTIAGTLDGQQISLTSYYSGGTTGGGLFKWDSASTVADDGGVTIAVTGVAIGRWVRLLDGFATSEMFGVITDGATVNDLTSVINFSDTTGFQVKFPKGVTVVEQISLDNKSLKIAGSGINETVLALNPATSNHLVTILNGGEFYANDLELNQGWDETKTAGHGVRLGGVNAAVFNNVRIKNCHSYGIGCQAGTNIGVVLGNVEIEETGQDATDIKDFNNNNGVTIINGYKAKRFGLSQTGQVALDVRGPILASNIDASLAGTSRGVRLRVGGPQGRGGFGCVNGVNVTSDGTATTGSAALDLSSDSDNFVISNVTASGLGLLILHNPSSVGGQLNNISGLGMTNTEACSFSGSGLTISGLTLSNSASAARCIDFEPGSSDIQISDFKIDNTAAGTAGAVRVQAGCNDIALLNGRIYGGNVGDAGTATIQDNVRLL